MDCPQSINLYIALIHLWKYSHKIKKAGSCVSWRDIALVDLVASESLFDELLQNCLDRLHDNYFGSLEELFFI